MSPKNHVQKRRSKKRSIRRKSSRKKTSQTRYKRGGGHTGGDPDDESKQLSDKISVAFSNLKQKLSEI